MHFIWRSVSRNQALLLQLALKYADTALEQAETATAPEASVPEFPNYDRDGRLAIFKGRALDARGWSLFQLKRNKEAVTALNDSIAAYGSLTRREAGRVASGDGEGDYRRTSRGTRSLHRSVRTTIDGSSVDIKRSVIEGVYKKVHGSLAGLDEKIGVASPAIAAASKRTNRVRQSTACNNAATGPAPADIAPATEPKNEAKIETQPRYRMA